MKKRMMFTVLLVGGMLMIFCGVFISRAYALTLVEPWTYEAATFNPQGVAYGDGITTGDELKAGYQHTWTKIHGERVAEALNELNVE